MPVIEQHLTRPLHTPAAWRGSQMAASEAWVVRPTQAQIDELAATCDALDGRPWHDVGRDDVPLPSWSATVRDLQQQLEGGRGFALIRSLPLAGRSVAAARTMLWALGMQVGDPEPQDAAGSLLHDVRDTGRDLRAADIRAYQTRLPINYHNDGADVFLLLCCRAAASGGRSRLVSAVSVFNDIVTKRPDLAAVLQRPFHFDARGQQRPGAPPFQTVPVYSYHAGYLNVLYKREYIDLAQRFDDVPALRDEQREALDWMDRTCDELAFEFTMAPGDLLMASNYDILHGRSAFDDEPAAADADRRHMLRLWLSLPNGRPLPPAFADTREFAYSYRRRAAAAT